MDLNYPSTVRLSDFFWNVEITLATPRRFKGNLTAELSPEPRKKKERKRKKRIEKKERKDNRSISQIIDP